MPGIVIVASQQRLLALRAHKDLASAIAFSDTEALQALDAITQQRPSLVVIDHEFAATSRGNALINRITGDPALTRCLVQVTDDNVSQLAIDPTAQAPDAAIPRASSNNIDRRGTRRVARFKVTAGMEALVDGNPAMLVDVSTLGAQIISPTVLKPNQRIRFLLPDSVASARFNGGIVWAAFEMPKEGAVYRAGILFFNADVKALDIFIENSKVRS